MQKVFFDNAATTPILPEVVKAMLHQLENIYGNPSSTHHFGREAKGYLEGARRSIAQCIGAKPSQICFTSCGTESNNMVLRNAISSLGIKRIISSAIEHPAILKTAKDVAKDIELIYTPLLPDGRVDITKFEELLIEKNIPTLVTIMHANNEIGTLNPIREICSISKKHGAIVHSDMVQTIGHLPINASELDIDYISASAHKFHGPKGIGFLFTKTPNSLGQLISGGSQERGMRSGTENLSGIVGMQIALEASTANIDADMEYVNNLRWTFWELLKKNIPNIDLITPKENSLYTVLAVGFPPNMSSEMLHFQLDMKGIACSSGSACSSGAAYDSHVLEAIGYPKNRKAIRFSFSKLNTIQEVEFAAGQIKQLYNEMNSLKS